MDQGSPYQDDTYGGQQNSRKGRPKHPHSPESHTLLGVKISLSAVVFVRGLLLIVRSFNSAGNSVQKVLDGEKVYWLSVFGWLGLALISAGLAAAVPTYRLSIYADG